MRSYFACSNWTYHQPRDFDSSFRTFFCTCSLTLGRRGTWAVMLSRKPLAELLFCVARRAGKRQVANANSSGDPCLKQGGVGFFGKG